MKRLSLEKSPTKGNPKLKKKEKVKRNTIANTKYS